MEEKNVRTRNDRYQLWDALRRNRQKRSKTDLLFVEGVLPIEAAVTAGWTVVEALAAAGKPLSGWARDWLGRSRCPVLYRLDPVLMGELSDREETSELILILKSRDLTLPGPGSDLPALAAPRLVILDRPVSPGNLGTVVRTCDAFGIGAVIISGHGADPYDPKAIAASRGTVFTIPLITAGSNAWLDLFLADRKLADGGFTVYGSSAKGGTELRDCETAPSWCLILGNESSGMNEFLKGLCDRVLTIGMTGQATSLNIACAASILLYGLVR
jgi:TrmH family RNA methyltransferase